MQRKSILANLHEVENNNLELLLIEAQFLMSLESLQGSNGVLSLFISYVAAAEFWASETYTMI